MRSSIFLSLFVSLFTSLVLAQDADFRTLTDKRGRTVVAKIVRVVGAKVQIERKDGKRYVMDINTFSEPDQEIMMRFAAGAAPAGGQPVAAPGAPGMAPDERGPLPEDQDEVFAFKDIRFKEKKTDHFMIFSSARQYEPADPYAEKTWELIDEIFPTTFRNDYERQKFAAPGKGSNKGDFSSEDSKFRYRIYFAQTPEEYTKMLQQHVGNLPADQQARLMATAPRTGNFDDRENRWLVIRKDRRDARSYSNLLVHNLAVNLASGHSQRAGAPLWLSAGLGYWAENKLFKRCAILYVDFEAYYGEQGNLQEGEILNSTNPWAKPVRALCRKGTKYTANDIINADVSSLSPELSGYIFAFTSFLLSNEDRRRKFHKMMYDQRTAPSQFTADSIVTAMGYPNTAAFEKDWYDYILSNDFK